MSKDYMGKKKDDTLHPEIWIRQFALTSLFLVVTVFRIVTEPIIDHNSIYENNKGLLDYFTNWAWTLHTIFFLCTTIGLFKPYFLKFGIRWLLLPSYGVAWIVLVEVSIILCFNTKKVFTENIPDYLLFNGHVVMHCVPIIADLLFFSYNRESIKMYLAHESPHKDGFIWYIYQLLSPVGLQLIYRFVHDPYVVYGADVPEWIGWSVAVIVSVIFNLGRLWEYRIKKNTEDPQCGTELQLIHIDEPYHMMSRHNLSNHSINSNDNNSSLCNRYRSSDIDFNHKQSNHYSESPFVAYSEYDGYPEMNHTF